jgi:sugar/nucleoside kinase (ribokinase family)
MRYAAVLGEALLDLLDGECGGQPVYRQAIGGAPLNVAVGVARLGGSVEFIGALGDDVPARRIEELLIASGVGRRGVQRVAAPTALGVVTFDAAEPDFRFSGAPPSYGLLAADALDTPLITQAAVLYCGSIALLQPRSAAAARRAWSLAAGLRVFDPNVRPRLLPDATARDDLRAVVEEFAGAADLVKLSAVDADLLWPGAAPAEVAGRLRAAGARTVVVTLGAEGALVLAGPELLRVPAPLVRAVDTTGAGDAVMAALIADLLIAGPPAQPAGWAARVAAALRVAGLVCESPGGAVAMPTRAEVAARFPH